MKRSRRGPREGREGFVEACDLTIVAPGGLKPAVEVEEDEEAEGVVVVVGQGECVLAFGS